MSKECQHDGADIETAIWADGLCKKCDNCEWWERNRWDEIKYKGRVGECRRYPKTEEHRDDFWCGEFKEKEAK